jgi:hypothetical protein
LIKLTAPDTLETTGYYLHPEDYPIILPLNWSVFGYLRSTPHSVMSLFSPIVSNVSIVKDGMGNVYWPQYFLNMIGDLKPGQGYQIKMLQQAIYFFPPN